MGAPDCQEAYKAQQRKRSGGVPGQHNPVCRSQLGNDWEGWGPAAEELGNGVHEAERGPGVTLAANKAHSVLGFVRRSTACRASLGLCQHCLSSRLNTQPHCANWQQETHLAKIWSHKLKQ